MENDSDELRQESAREWSHLYRKYLKKELHPAGDMKCKGCRSDDGLFIGARDCSIQGMLTGPRIHNVCQVVVNTGPARC